MAHEFPKLFCVCKFWVEHLDIAEIHQAVAQEKEKWFINCVQNNLRMFSKTIFPTVTFENNRVSNAKAVALLHSGSIVKEIGNVETSNGVYCETINGCCRYENQNGEVYLKQVNFKELEHIYSPKGQVPLPFYLRFARGNRYLYHQFHENAIYPGTLIEVSKMEENSTDEYISVKSSRDIWLKREDLEKKRFWFFTFPSINQEYLFVDMRKQKQTNIEGDPQIQRIPKAGEENISARNSEVDVTEFLNEISDAQVTVQFHQFDSIEDEDEDEDEDEGEGFPW